MNIKSITDATQLFAWYRTAAGIFDNYSRKFGTYGDVDATIASLNAYAANFSKSNAYTLVLPLPSFLPNTNFQDMLQVFGKAVSVPSTSLGEKTTFVGTTRRSTQGVVVTDNFTITLNDTSTNFFHNLFSTWQHARIANMSGNGKAGAIQYYPEEFTTDASIFRKVPSGEDIRQVYGMANIYPLTVGDLRYDEDATDQLQVFDVTFHVDNLIHYPVTSPGV